MKNVVAPKSKKVNNEDLLALKPIDPYVDLAKKVQQPKQAFILLREWAIHM